MGSLRNDRRLPIVQCYIGKQGKEIVGKTKADKQATQSERPIDSRAIREDIQGIQIPTTPTLINRVDSLQPLW